MIMVRFTTLLWRHNGCDSVSNHQHHDCLFNRLFKRRSKKTSKLRVTGLCAGNSPGLVNSPHKWPVTRKMFPFDDVIMKVHHYPNSVPTSFVSHANFNRLPGAMVWPKLCTDLIAKDDITTKSKFHGISNTRKIKQNKQNKNRKMGGEMGSSCFKKIVCYFGKTRKTLFGKSHPCLWYKNIIVFVIDVLLFPMLCNIIISIFRPEQNIGTFYIRH